MIDLSKVYLIMEIQLISEASHLKLSIPKPLQDSLTWKWGNILDKDLYPAYLFLGASQPSMLILATLNII